MKTFKLTDKQTERLVKVLEYSIKLSKQNIEGISKTLKDPYIAWTDEQKEMFRSRIAKTETALIEKESILEVLKKEGE